MTFAVVEKANQLAVHCIADTKERAEHWIAVNAVEYCEKGYFSDKTLTPESFEVIETKQGTLTDTFILSQITYRRNLRCGPSRDWNLIQGLLNKYERLARARNLI